MTESYFHSDLGVSDWGWTKLDAQLVGVYIENRIILRF